MPVASKTQPHTQSHRPYGHRQQQADVIKSSVIGSARLEGVTTRIETQLDLQRRFEQVFGRHQ
ncbi:MAG TPA: hypothetical protein EYP05_05790 [Piscirickettsiaceae bacterium]|nr:hypothetical protein [Piscirickettsiaceae bacterium]HIQ39565.1 hypothetical protein [Sulfurivirga caldicuralii]